MPAEAQFVSVVYKPIDLVPEGEPAHYIVFDPYWGKWMEAIRVEGVWGTSPGLEIHPTHFVELPAPGVRS